MDKNLDDLTLFKCKYCDGTHCPECILEKKKLKEKDKKANEQNLYEEPRVK